MAPAIECRTCGFKAQTATLTGDEKEMTGLMDEYAGHAVKHLVDAMHMTGGRGSKRAHRMDMVYYEITPDEGFEFAKIIRGITVGSYHLHKV